MNNSYYLSFFIDYFNNMYMNNKATMDKKYKNKHIENEEEKRKYFKSVDDTELQNKNRKKPSKIKEWVSAAIIILVSSSLLTYGSMKFPMPFSIAAVTLISGSIILYEELRFYMDDMDKLKAKKINYDYMLYKLGKDRIHLNFNMINSLLEELHQQRLYPKARSLVASGLITAILGLTSNKTIAEYFDSNHVHIIVIHYMVAFLAMITNMTLIYFYVKLNEKQKNLVITHFYLTTLRDHFLDTNLK